jgi:hypothetical protein
MGFDVKGYMQFRVEGLPWSLKLGVWGLGKVWGLGFGVWVKSGVWGLGFRI